METRMICVECGWVHKPGKGVTSCAACGGKTREGLPVNKDRLVVEDMKRFSGETAKEQAWKKDE